MPTEADARRFEEQLVGDDPDPTSVAALIAERLGSTGIAVGHLFDGVDPWC